MREARLFWPTLLAVAGVAVLVGLGIWQLQRMQWKDGLMARIAERAKAPPKTLGEILALRRATDDVEYHRVRLDGAFRHEREAHYFTVIGGETGWRVVTPFVTSDAIVLVDRGFVPDRLKEPDTRRDGRIAGRLTLTGLVRAPGRRGLFTPANEPDRNNWFWRDLEGMARTLLDLAERERLAPFFVEAEAGDIPGGWPRGGVTRLELPNRHLEYAVTWFALAATLGGVYLVFARSRLRAARMPDKA